MDSPYYRRDVGVRFDDLVELEPQLFESLRAAGDFSGGEGISRERFAQLLGYELALCVGPLADREGALGTQAALDEARRVVFGVLGAQPCCVG